MNRPSITDDVPRGLLRPELFLGVAFSVTARTVGVNLSDAGQPSGSHFAGGRYGRGEVGEFVLIEGQQSLLLGRISEIRTRETERRSIRSDFAGDADLDAIGQVQLLGCVAMDDLMVKVGVDAYPRLGDRIYAAPHRFIARLPRLMDSQDPERESVTLRLGTIGTSPESNVSIKPERIFGRHCAIIGATGGGKSWTTARIIEECIRHAAKLILIDATGEYREFSGDRVRHCHLGEPVERAEVSVAVSLPPTSFQESDFIALFEPAGKVQGPKLRAAIRSLRLAHLMPALAEQGIIKKIQKPKAPVENAEADSAISKRLDNPREPFDVMRLVPQLEQECVWPNGGTSREPDTKCWGGRDDQSYSNCLTLFARINGILNSSAFACVFGNTENRVTDELDTFVVGIQTTKLLRICLSGVAHEYHAREVIANVIGRYLLNKARAGDFRQQPMVVMVDEAHNFLGRHFGAEDYEPRLDAFELIAKEGRKYGLNICLVSQRPRDITEGVLSQMGTLIVHRLTNDRDREVVERACGEIDRAAAAFLPNLRAGEAVIIGTDFPIPLTVQVTPPTTRPLSGGPDYQRHWSAPKPVAG